MTDFTYTAGTITVTNGSATATGTLTAFSGIVYQGDLLLIGNNLGVVAADASSETSLTLTQPWSGSSASGVAYTILLFSPRHTWPTDVWDRVREALSGSTNILNGTAAPAPSVGVIGDVFFDTTNQIFYGAKTSSGWPAGVALKGLGVPVPSGAPDIGKVPRVVSPGTTYALATVDELLASAPLRQNLLINPSFAVNTRGFAGGSLAASTYGFDRWKAGASAATITVSAGVVSLAGEVIQIVEPDVWGLATFVAAPVTISLVDPSHDVAVAFGGVSGTIVAGSGVKSLTLTPTAGGNATLSLQRSGGGTVTFKCPRVELGSVATTEIPRPAALENLLCGYYYQSFVNAAANMFWLTNYVGGGGNYSAWGFSFPRMRAAPTFTLVGTWSLSNLSSLAAAAAANSIVLYGSSVAAGSVGAISPANGGFTLSAEL